jgi:ribokinase
MREEVDETLKHFSKGDFLILQNEISEISYIMNKAHEKGSIYKDNEGLL